MAGTRPCIGPIQRPTGIVQTDVRQGQRRLSITSPLKNKCSGRQKKMQYPRQPGTMGPLRFARRDADGGGAKKPLYGVGGWEH